MNCWPSEKYVHLLYMYSMLGRSSFCFNFCLNSAWHGGDQFVALVRWYGSPYSMGFSSGEFAGQSSTPTPWSFNQLLVLLAVWAGAKSCWKTGVCGWDERMDATHLSVFHSVSNHTRGKCSSLPRLRTLSTHFFFLEQETVRYSSYIIWLIFT